MVDSVQYFWNIIPFFDLKLLSIVFISKDDKELTE